MELLSILLTVVFVVLKLTGVIAWSWWLVFTPVIVVAVLSIVILAIVGALAHKVLGRGKF